MTKITKATIKRILRGIDTSMVTIINNSDSIEVWVKDCEYDEQERVVTEIAQELPNAYIAGSPGNKDIIYWKDAFGACNAHNANMRDQFGLQI